jgi:hypothetical protein
MLIKKMITLTLAACLTSLAGAATAQPAANTFNFCTKKSGTISSGHVGVQQEKVIYGPYKVTCGTTSHHFNVKGASGQVPVTVQQLKNGGWASITAATYDPSGRFGAGIFRLVIDNRQSNTPVSHTGTFVVPM